MKLFIDESGNTGPTKIKNLVSNFADQPYYSLTGILLNNEQEKQLNSFIENSVQKFDVHSNELKAKNLYETEPNLIIELIKYISQKQIPCFTEIMEKKYYMNIQILEAFIAPSHLTPLFDELIAFKNFIASNLSEYLSDKIYEKFCKACQSYTANEFESFIQFIKRELNKKPIDYIKQFLLDMTNMAELSYFALKSNEPTEAFKSYLPIPDKIHNKNYVFMLPNYQAFSHLIGRANLYINKNKCGDFKIIHDEQKQFDIIYKKIIQDLKTLELESNEMIKDTIIEEKINFNIDENLSLHFEKSQNLIPLQCVDLLSGFVMRYLKDFEDKKIKRIKRYKKSILQLIDVPMPEGINFVIPDQDFSKLIDYLEE